VNAALGAVASAALAGLVALAAYAGSFVLASAVGLVVLATALGWSALFDLPSPLGSAVLVGAAGVAAVALALAVQHEARPLAWFAALMAACVLAAFVRELVRRPPREALVESLTGTLAGEVVVVFAASWLLVPRTGVGGVGVLLGAVAVGVARLVTALPLSSPLTGWIGLGAGTAAAMVVAAVVSPVHLGPGALIGVAVAAVVAGLDRLLAHPQATRGTAALVASSAAPVAAAGVVAYAIARLFAV
jgi:iron complex transport system permease protein